MKAPWRRLLDLLLQFCLGRQDLSGQLGTAGDVLGFNGTQWGPVPGGGGAAIGLDVVFRPGGVAGGNVFTTWSTAWNQATSPIMHGGPVTLAVDDSIAAANVDPGAWDMHGIDLRVGNPAGQATLNIPSGSQLQNVGNVEGVLTLASTPLVADPAPLLYSAGGLLAMTGAATLDNSGGARPMVDVATGTFLGVVNQQGAFTPGAGAAQIFNPLGTAAIAINAVETLIGLPGQLLAPGGAASTVSYLRDNTSTSPTGAGYLGTLTVTHRTGPRTVTSTALNGAGTVAVDALYSAGTGPAEDNIFVSPAGINTSIVTLSDSRLAYNAGREIKIIAVATAAVNLIQLSLQVAADSLQGVPGNVLHLQGPVGTVFFIETDGVTGWFVGSAQGV